MSLFMGVEEVAEVLEVPVSTVRHWIYTNTGPVKFAKIGRRVKARRADVDAWINAQFGN